MNGRRASTRPRVVGRDVENVHDDLKRLDRLDVIDFAEEGQAKRPVVRFDELVVRVPLTEHDDEPPEATVSHGQDDSEDVPERRRSGVDLEETYGRITDAFLALDTDARA